MTLSISPEDNKVQEHHMKKIEVINRQNITMWIIVILLVLLYILCSLVLLAESKWAKLPVIEPAIMKSGKLQSHTIMPFSFTNQQGIPVSSKAWQGKIWVANFIFTHCPVVCPRMTANLKAVQLAFKNDTAIQMLSFTIDPDRDSCSQLRKFADRFGININKWQLLTGSKPAIYRLARSGFLVVATDGDGGPDDFIHSEKVVLVDRHQRIRGFYTGTDKGDIENLIQDIKKLKNEEE